jgi:hypothetical protein
MSGASATAVFDADVRNSGDGRASVVIKMSALSKNCVTPID